MAGNERLAIYVNGESEREALRGHFSPQSSVCFWPPSDLSDSADQWLIDKEAFFAFGDIVVVVLAGIESMSFLLGALRLTSEERLTRLYVVGLESLDGLPIMETEDRLTIDRAVKDGRLLFFRDVAALVVYWRSDGCM